MPDQQRLNELQQVEEPFLRQLERLGWCILHGDKYDPAPTLREDFSEVILEKELRAALKQINPWLEEDQVTEAVHRIQTLQSNNLVKANQEALTLLLEGWPVFENHQTHERSPNVRFLDFNYTANNRFLAVSQFKISVPGTEKHILPDIVLFVNGLPLVVVECKSPTVADPLGEAVEQLMRYANRRGMQEGNEKLFWYNQFQVATFRHKCCYSTITGEHEHFIEWKDPYPSKLADIDAEGGEAVNSQQILIQGMLTPDNLLDIVHSYTVFSVNDKGKVIKLAPRYQQYRTARKIVERLKSSDSPKEKGGIIWHTQGSGKSLTMMFVVRAMYHDRQLNKYKIVFITDRTDLEKQLGDTAESVGYSLKKAGSIAALKDYLRSTAPDLVMGMIHKFQENELLQAFPILNTSPDILVMIDEAHRGQYKILGANLQVALPNAVRLAFTGTPIDKTEKTFGDYIDKYSIRQAVEDGVTVEIVYEGRTHKGEVINKEEMNQRFEDVFSMVDKDERQLILDRYTWRAYLEDDAVIRDKAADMLAHYLEHVFPNHFKAQVVTVSRLAAIRYKLALQKALKQRISTMVQSQEADPEDLKLLQRMKVEVVISGTNNDESVYKPYTEEDLHAGVIASFKLPFDQVTEDGIRGDVGILVVQSMLITGFDAPVEQVMYLDNVIKEHNLLQAIARVNRVSKNKSCGYIVDYVGVARHLRQALAVFDEKDTEEILDVVVDSSADKDTLKYIHSQVNSFFDQFDVPMKDIDACVVVLVDEEVRNDFIALMHSFSKAIDRVLPDPEALKFVHDLRQLSWIAETARNTYRDDKLSIREASRKIREIVDEFLISKGVDPKIPPLPIFSDAFKARLRQSKNPRVTAEEITHVIREHINTSYETDPEFYDRLGEKLERVLAEYRDNWDKLAKELEEVLETLRQGRAAENSYGLNPRSELPFLALLKRELYGSCDLKDLPEIDLHQLLSTTNDLLEIIRRETRQVDFWENYPAQKRLKSYILTNLLMTFKGNLDFIRNRNQVAQKLLELAMHTNLN